MSGILSGTSVAATALSAATLRVYLQDDQGGIREGTYPTAGSPSGWGVSKSPIFKAKLFTPLSVISWNDGKEASQTCNCSQLTVRFAFMPFQTMTLSKSGSIHLPEELRGLLAI